MRAQQKFILIGISFLSLLLTFSIFFGYQQESQTTPLSPSDTKESSRPSTPQGGLSSPRSSQERSPSASHQVTIKKSEQLIAVEHFDFNGQPQKTHITFVETVSYFRNHPEDIHIIKKKILELDPHSEIFMKQVSFLTGILAEQFAQEAEIALVDLLEDSDNKTIKIQAISAIGDLENISTHSITKLTELSSRSSPQDILKDLADLNLGIMASHLRKKQEREKADLISQHLKEMTQNRPAREQEQMLDSLGNDGSVIHLPVIIQFLESHDQIIRGRAVYQLRKMPPRYVLQLIAELLTHEKTTHVWKESLKVLKVIPKEQFAENYLDQLALHSPNQETKNMLRELE